MASFLVTLVKVFQVVVDAPTEGEACTKAVEVPPEHWMLGHTEIGAEEFTGEFDDFSGDMDDDE